MTCIAWDGRSLAADRRVTEGGDICAEVIKIRRCKDGRLVGAAGNLDAMSLLLDWLEMGANRDERPDCLSNRNMAEAIEIMPNGDVWNHLQHGRVKLCRGPQAIGSGAPYARAAMLCQRDAKKSVEIAAKLDTGTGGRIDCLVLKD